MTAYSYNGWPAGSRETAKVVVRSVPGTSVALPVNGDCADLLLWFAAQWHRRVEKLEPNWCWGWADRTVRGSTTVVSNHASGTAIDLNAPKHPRGVPLAKTFTDEQVATIRSLLGRANLVDHVLDWGGNYRVSPVDGMHVEIAPGATRAQVEAAFRRVSARPKPKPKPTVPPPTLWRSTANTAKNRPWVVKLQRGLHVSPDGRWGPVTTRALVAYRKTHKLGRPYRVAGPKVWRSLGIK